MGASAGAPGASSCRGGPRSLRQACDLSGRVQLTAAQDCEEVRLRHVAALAIDSPERIRASAARWMGGRSTCSAGSLGAADSRRKIENGSA
eukprot:5058856-Pyramimonas_sp.AAC.1